jgi:hypothetical protein
MTAETQTLAAPTATPGAGWRAATWVLLAVDVLIVFLLLQLQGQKGPGFDIIAAAMFVGTFLALIGLTIAGAGAGVIGALRGSDHGDRRAVIFLPVFLHVVLLMGAFVALSAGN